MKSLAKKIIITLTVMSIVISGLAFVPAKVSADKAPAWPNVYVNTVAKSSCLIDYDTGTVLYEKGSHKKRYPASITKILTALLTIENCDMNETVTYSKYSLSCIKDGAANIGACSRATWLPSPYGAATPADGSPQPVRRGSPAPK